MFENIKARVIVVLSLYNASIVPQRLDLIDCIASPGFSAIGHILESDDGRTVAPNGSIRIRTRWHIRDHLSPPESLDFADGVLEASHRVRGGVGSGKSASERFKADNFEFCH